VDAELAFHLEERTAELMEREHLDRADAASEVGRRFGDVAEYRRQLRTIDDAGYRRDARTEIVSTALREFRQALRSLRRSRTFSSLAVITLALGLGASTTIFSLLDRIVVQPLAYPHADRLVRIGTKWPGIKVGEEYGTSEFMFQRFQEQSKTLDQIGIYHRDLFTLPAEGSLEAERVSGIDASASLFGVLGIRPELGRTFTAADQIPLDAPVIVLSHALWVRRYARDPAIVGRTIDVIGKPKQVIGVLPPSAQLPDLEAEFWLPLHLDPAEPPHNNHVFQTIGLVKEGVSVERASHELDGLTRRITSDYPGVYPAGFLQKTGFGLFVRSLHDDVVGPDIARSLWIIFASVGLVLFIAAANVASLFLIRIDARRREITVRTALGADRRRLAVHYLSESMLISVAAGIGAIALAFLLLRVVLAFAPANLPRLDEVHLDGWSVGFCAVAAALVGVIFGLLPSMQSRFDASMLREGGRGLTSSRSQSTARRSLVIVQVALSMVLLVSAGLLAKSFDHLRSVRAGFNAHGVVTMMIALRPDRYGNDAQIVAFWHELARRTAAVPGVTSTGATSALPLAGDAGCSGLAALDSPLDPSQRNRCVATLTVAPGYFATMRIPVEGGEPGWSDNESAAGTMVVSRTLAERFWPGESAIGKSLVIQQRRRLVYRISGIAADVRADGLQKPPIEAAYFPIASPATAGPSARTDLDGNYMSFVVRSTSDDPYALGVAVRRIVREMDPRVPVADVRSMDDIVAKSMARSSFTMLLLAIAASIALTLSAIGIYGVISYTVAQRRSEIGIRMALGARMARVRGIVVGQSVRLVAIGAAAGVLLAIAAMRVMRSLLFEVSPGDPVVLVGAALVLLVVALAASYVPARRAAAIDPAEALRAE
jgi:predicted permease